MPFEFDMDGHSGTYQTLILIQLIINSLNNFFVIL